MKIEIFNNNIKIKANPLILKKLSEYFIFKDASYCFVGGKFDKNKIINRKLLTIKHDTAYLPIGLYNQLFKLNTEFNISSIIDNRNPIKYNITGIKNNLHYLTLFDYQIKAVNICLKQINCIIKLPTSSGKTEIFLSICNLLKISTIIVFSRIDLARQTMKRAKKAKLDCGIVQGNEVDENHMIIITTIQSAHKLQNKYKMVIVDECHRASSNKYQKFLERKDFIYRFGFSATPFNKDEYKNVLIKKFLGEIEYTLPANLLIEQGKIALPKINIIEINNPKIYLKNWRDIEKAGIVNNEIRNIKISELANKLDFVLILVQKIFHGKLLKSIINNSIFLSGNSIDREEGIEEFKKGNIVLIASTIFDEGISINCIKNLIIAGGGLSHVKTIQRIGRGLRINEEKTEVNIYDFLDNTNKILNRHSNKRISFYKKEGFKDIKII